MRKGSVTLFCALSLMLIASLLFALAESSRFYGLDCYAQMKADAAIDSVCAEYQPYLWKQYGLLFLDGAYGTEQFSMSYVMERLSDYMQVNCETGEVWGNALGTDLFRMAKGEVLLEGYALATDDGGNLFLNYVSEREKQNLPLGIAEALYEQYQKTEQLEKENDGTDLLTAAQKAVQEAKSEWELRQKEELEKNKSEKREKSGENADTTDVSIQPPDTTFVDNLLNIVQQSKSNGVINIICEDVTKISDGVCELEEDLQQRQKEVGTLYLKTDKDWYQKILVLTYLEEYFANYINPKREHLLNYEMEYVLCGKDTEMENLSGTFERLLLLREAANAAYLFTDRVKMQQAEEAAAVIGLLAGGNYAIAKAVQFGIVAAWAYAESVLDVRSLVKGGVIPLIKQEAEWTTEIKDILSVFDKSAEAKKCVKGFNYTDYLKQLLFLTDNQKLAYRMMEVMEIGLRGCEEYKNCRMDHMITALRFKIAFESRPLFSRLISVGRADWEKYIFRKEVERSYVP